MADPWRKAASGRGPHALPVRLCVCPGLPCMGHDRNEMRVIPHDLVRSDLTAGHSVPSTSRPSPQAPQRDALPVFHSFML